MHLHSSSSVPHQLSQQIKIKAKVLFSLQMIVNVKSIWLIANIMKTILIPSDMLKERKVFLYT